MKKLLAAGLVSVTAFAMSTTALAAGQNTMTAPGQEEITVTGKYVDSTTAGTVYSVDLSWDEMIFTYTETGSLTWNPDEHSYSENISGGWDKTEADITVTNHSNADVKVEMTYAPEASTGVTGSIANGEFVLDAGAENQYDSADYGVSTLTVSGTPNETVTEEGVTVGTITVKLTDAQGS